MPRRIDYIYFYAFVKHRSVFRKYGYTAFAFKVVVVQNKLARGFVRFLEQLGVNDEKVVAIGEIGLDYHWIKDPVQRELQKEYFIRQIQFANEHHLPICIHNRDSNEDCFNILKEYRPLYGLVMHCYSGSVEMMKEIVKWDKAYISLGGPVTFTNAKTPKEVAEEVPLDRLLIETDSPYLTPHPHRGEKNEPKYICLVLEEIARLRNMSKKHLESTLFANSCRVFNIKNEE